VAFFPLLVAGPIERANHLLPQVRKKRFFNYEQAVDGCRLILWGLFKKVVVADSLTQVVDIMFKDPQEFSGFSLIRGAVAFSFQIYGDFSGYSDIALGTAKLFGFELLSNFKFPYFSRDIAEFWRRWHISLSSWFRDYLYIPLGGSKNGKLTAVRNTFIIFLVSGFWHGASWNFIMWGFIHACGFLPLLLLNRNRNHVTDVVASERAFPSIKEIWQMISTFAFVTLAWIFFRAETISGAFNYLEHMFKGLFIGSVGRPQLPEDITISFYIIPLLLGDWWMRRNERKLRVGNKWVNYFVYLLLGTLIYMKFGTNHSFIYFQF
jgi:D-alanyl-lipoteichoic acid acyltransferase DltB (MBOAT superfamily)